MKAKKALRRLAKVETLLSTVINKYEGKPDTRELLDSAKASVVQAKKTVATKPAAKKPPVKASSSKTRVAAKAKPAPAGKTQAAVA